MKYSEGLLDHFSEPTQLDYARTESSPVDDSRTDLAASSYATYLSTLPRFHAVAKEDKLTQPPSYDHYLQLIPRFAPQLVGKETPADISQPLTSYQAYLAMIPHFAKAAEANETPKAVTQPMSYDAYTKLIPTFSGGTDSGQKMTVAGKTYDVSYKSYTMTLPSFMPQQLSKGSYFSM